MVVPSFFCMFHTPFACVCIYVPVFACVVAVIDSCCCCISWPRGSGILVDSVVMNSVWQQVIVLIMTVLGHDTRACFKVRESKYSETIYVVERVRLLSFRTFKFKAF